MKYIPEEDLWVGENNRFYIKNEWKHDHPNFIDITTNVWCTHHNGSNCYINWDDFLCSEEVIKDLKFIFKEKLKHNSPLYINKLRVSLNNLFQKTSKCYSGFYDIAVKEWIKIWGVLDSSSRIIVRETYGLLALNDKCGASNEIYNELKSWRARKNVRILKDVLDWSPHKGALTSDESIILRKLFINKNDSDVNLKHYSARIFGWILFETLKRTVQISGLKKDALKKIANNEVDEYFLLIPKSKQQIALGNDLWKISTKLAEEIIAYSSRPDVKELQNKFNRLIVWDCPSLRERGQISSEEVKQCLQTWVKRQRILSPRTDQYLHVTPRRIRHTGATRLAVQGFSINEIQTILEHDNPASCQAYIDAIGVDLIPEIERADRKLGSLFSRLNHAFFNGDIVEAVSDNPIYIPDSNNSPAIVGSCSRDSIKNGICPNHPFYSCYDGCPSFLAWRDADHSKAGQYIEKELHRWNQAQGHKDRNKNIKDFERIYKAINEVIDSINQEIL